MQYHNRLATLLLAIFLVAALGPPPGAASCGYQKCRPLNWTLINVHLIPQSHDDVGWRKTVDQYYYGNRQGYARGAVQYILDSVINELDKDQDKRFHYVEMAYFFQWWDEQDQPTRDKVKRLVDNGQLEMTMGGWVSNDEAVTWYGQTIDQLTLGMKRLNETFGRCAEPRIGWQIDPFGHSQEQASIFAQMGFDAFFFSRLDSKDRASRRTNKSLELIWRGDKDLGVDSEIFTHIMQLGFGYGSPPGVCFDLIHCPREQINSPVIDNPDSREYNVNQKVKDFISIVKWFADYYTTNNILIPIGSDFQFMDAHSYFKNLDKMIKYVNQRTEDTNIHVLYSTPMCYTRAVHLENKTYSVKTDDFFPFGYDQHTFWAGYYTSRPALKRNERTAANVLTACKQLNLLAALNEGEKVDRLRQEMAVMQHHDAVTGTNKQHVTYDYQRRMAIGVERCRQVINKAYHKLNVLWEQSFCDRLNASECRHTEQATSFGLSVYNPLARPVEEYIRLPVDNHADSYFVMNASMNNLLYDMVPIPEAVLKLPERRSRAIKEIVFKAQLPALGFAKFFVMSNMSSETTRKENNPIQEVKSAFTVKGKNIEVNFENGLKSIKLKNGQVIRLNQTFLMYSAMEGNNKKQENRAAGHYIFRPMRSQPIDLGLNKTTAEVHRGKLVTEVHQKFPNYPWVYQTIKVYHDQDVVEFDWVIGPLPTDDRIGKEVIIRFDSDLNSRGRFFTDANGRQMIGRQRNARPTYRYNVSAEPVASNYYPVTSRIFIKDQTKDIRMTAFVDRAQAGSSLRDGSLELLLHRRLLHDDDFGVDELLNEPGVDGRGLIVRGQTILHVAPEDLSTVRLGRELVQQLVWQPIVSFDNYTRLSDEQWLDSELLYSGLNSSLPPNVHLLTLDQWDSHRFLLRLEHFYQSEEDSSGTMAKEATVDLKTLFKSLKIRSAVETTLGANQWLGEVNKLKWRKDKQNDDKNLPRQLNDLVIKLKPMQIRTFIVKLEH